MSNSLRAPGALPVAALLSVMITDVLKSEHGTDYYLRRERGQRFEDHLLVKSHPFHRDDEEIGVLATIPDDQFYRGLSAGQSFDDLDAAYHGRQSWGGLVDDGEEEV